MGCCGAVRGLRWWALPRNAKRGHRRWRGCTRRVLGDVADSRKQEIQSGRISGRGLGKQLQAGAAAAKQVHECARKKERDGEHDDDIQAGPQQAGDGHLNSPKTTTKNDNDDDDDDNDNTPCRATLAHRGRHVTATGSFSTRKTVGGDHYCPRSP